MARGRIPDFFIIGAPKCGTTALYSYLREHAAIFAPAKELHYFCDDFPNYGRIKSQDNYLSLFDGVEAESKLAGDASVFYLYSEVAVRNIMAANAAAKVIIMLRDPVEMVQALHRQKLVSMDEDVDDFGTAWRLQAARAKGEHVPKRCREASHLQYRTVCSFAHQLGRVVRYVPKDQYRIIIFEEFAQDPQAAYDQVLAFLGLQPDGRTDFPRVNASHRWRWARMIEMLKDGQGTKPYGVAKKVVNSFGLRPGLAVKRWNRAVAPRPPIDAELRAELVDAFREDVRSTERLVGRPLPWSG
jgi:hypothetical protein